MALKHVAHLSITVMVVALFMGDVWLFDKITAFPIATPAPPLTVSIALAASIITYFIAQILLWFQARGAKDPRTWGD